MINKKHIGYYSGEKCCYEQKFGRYAGCFKPDVAYEGEQAGQTVTGIKSWGDCAKLCKFFSRQACKFWTWASSTCTKCTPETCSLYSEISNESAPNKYGFISGEEECQDIVYFEDNQDKARDIIHDEATNEIRGKCLVRKFGGGFEEPDCAPQEVPGYRFDKFSLTILSHLFRWAVSQTFGYERTMTFLIETCTKMCLELRAVNKNVTACQFDTGFEFVKDSRMVELRGPVDDDGIWQNKRVYKGPAEKDCLFFKGEAIVQPYEQDVLSIDDGFTCLVLEKAEGPIYTQIRHIDRKTWTMESSEQWTIGGSEGQISLVLLR